MCPTLTPYCRYVICLYGCSLHCQVILLRDLSTWLEPLLSCHIAENCASGHNPHSQVILQIYDVLLATAPTLRSYCRYMTCPPGNNPHSQVILQIYDSSSWPHPPLSSHTADIWHALLATAPTLMSYSRYMTYLDYSPFWDKCETPWPHCFHLLTLCIHINVWWYLHVFSTLKEPRAYQEHSDKCASSGKHLRCTPHCEGPLHADYLSGNQAFSLQY